MEKKFDELLSELSGKIVDKLIEKSADKPEEKPVEKTEEKPETKIEKSKVDDNTEVSAVFGELKALVAEMKKAKKEQDEAKEQERVAKAKIKQKEDMQEIAKSMLSELVKELGIKAPTGERKGRVEDADKADEKITKKNIEGMTVKQFKALPIDEQDQHVYDHFRKAMGLDDIAELKKALGELESEE